MNNSKHDRGWAILSTGAALIILLLVSVFGYTLINDWMQKRIWMNTASQLSRFTQAVKSYSGRYYDTLLAGASTTSPVIVTPVMLKNTGFLEQGFSETTIDGQRYRAALVRNSTNSDQLQALVYTEEGVGLPFLALRQIAMDITTGLGGYIWTPGIVTGAMGSWTVSLAGFGITTTGGHIASLLTADDLGISRGENDRLYRFSVTGKPDLNTMHTSINMGGNNLNNTGTVNAGNGAFSNNVTARNDIRSENGWFVTRDGKGWLDESHGGGFYMSDNDWVRALNNKNIYTGGQVRGGSVRADGRLSTGENLQLDGISTAGNSCDPNGLVSRDRSGAILSCVNRVWVKPFKPVVNIRYSGWSDGRLGGQPARVGCMDNETVTGGGGDVSSYEVHLFVSRADGNGWIVDGDTGSGIGYASVRAFAICMQN